MKLQTLQQTTITDAHIFAARQLYPPILSTEENGNAQLQKTKDFFAFLEEEKNGYWVKKYQAEQEGRKRAAKERAESQATEEVTKTIELVKEGKITASDAQQRLNYISESTGVSGNQLGAIVANLISAAPKETRESLVQKWKSAFTNTALLEAEERMKSSSSNETNSWIEGAKGWYCNKDVNDLIGGGIDVADHLADGSDSDKAKLVVKGIGVAADYLDIALCSKTPSDKAKEKADDASRDSLITAAVNVLWQWRMAIFAAGATVFSITTSAGAGFTKSIIPGFVNPNIVGGDWDGKQQPMEFSYAYKISGKLRKDYEISEPETVVERNGDKPLYSTTPVFYNRDRTLEEI